jgi:hypothetical protein
VIVTNLVCNSKGYAQCAAVFVTVLLATGCTKQPQLHPDHPRLTSHVVMRDVTFHSSSLDREMQYRVVLPASISGDEKLPAVYLLHGGGVDFRSWTNDSDVGRFAENGLI